MAKDNRTIVRAPRINNRAIKDEDELASLLTPGQGATLLESGAITGNWVFKGGEESPSSEEAKSTDSDELGLAAETNQILIEANNTLIETNARLSDELREARTTIELGSAENRQLRADNGTLKAKITRLEKKGVKDDEVYPESAIDGTIPPVQADAANTS